MRQGLGYFHETIFLALPTFYRRIDTALKQVLAPAGMSLSVSGSRGQCLLAV